MGSVPVHFALDRCITRKGSRRHRFVVCANHRFVQKAGRCSRGWAGVFAGPAMVRLEMDGRGFHELPFHALLAVSWLGQERLAEAWLGSLR